MILTKQNGANCITDPLLFRISNFANGISYELQEYLETKWVTVKSLIDTSFSYKPKTYPLLLRVKSYASQGQCEFTSNTVVLNQNESPNALSSIIFGGCNNESFARLKCIDAQEYSWQKKYGNNWINVGFTSQNIDLPEPLGEESYRVIFKNNGCIFFSNMITISPLKISLRKTGVLSCLSKGDYNNCNRSQFKRQ